MVSNNYYIPITQMCLRSTTLRVSLSTCSSNPRTPNSRHVVHAASAPLSIQQQHDARNEVWMQGGGASTVLRDGKQHQQQQEQQAYISTATSFELQSSSSANRRRRISSSRNHQRMYVDEQPQLLHAAAGRAHGQSLPMHRFDSSSRLPPQPAAVSDWQLTQLITAATSIADVAATVEQHQSHLNAIHVAAALARLAKMAQQQHPQHRNPQLWQQQQQLLLRATQLQEAQALAQQLLLPLLLHHGHAMGARGLANSTWALAKLQVLPQPRAMQQLVQCLVAAVPDMEPQHISSVLYACALWQQQQQQQQVWQQGHQGVVHGSAWGRSTSLQQQQQQLTDHSNTSTAAAAARQAAGIPAQLLFLLLDAAQAGMTNHADHWGPQALANTIYAAAVLQPPVTLQWAASFWQASSSSMAAAEPQHLSNMAWAVARLQLVPPFRWVGQWLGASAGKLPGATPQGLSNSLWAVAKLGWGSAVLQPLPCEQQQQGGSGSSSSTASTGGDSPVGSSWLGVFCSSSIGQLDAFSDQALSNCCWALGSIAQQQQQQQHIQHILQHSGWQQRLLAVLQPRLLGLSSQQLANTLWGLAAAGITPPEPWLASYVRASGPKLLGFKAQEASNTLLGLARLNHNPGKAWLSLCEAALGQQLQQCSSQAISNSLWAMLLLQHGPSEAWLLQQLLPEVGRRLQLPLASAIPAAAEASPGGSGHDSSSSSSSSGVDAHLAFTRQGLSVTLLCLARLSVKHAANELEAAASDSSSSSQLPGDFWQLALQWLLGTQQQQQQHENQPPQQPGSSNSSSSCSSSSSGVRSIGLLGCFTPQGLSYLAGAAALAAAQQHSSEQLVLAVMAQLTQQQQQQAGQVQLADAAMVLWASARLQLQPPADLVMSLATAALEQLQHITTITRSSSSSAAHFVSLCGPGCKYLGALLYGLAVLGFHPGSRWFRCWFSTTQPLLQQCSAWTLAALLWGCAWLQQLPPAGWLAAWMRAWQQQQQQQQKSAGQVVAAAAREWMTYLRTTAADAAVKAGSGKHNSSSSSSNSSSVYGAASDRSVLYRLCMVLLGKSRQGPPVRRQIGVLRKRQRLFPGA
jgi:hypothetical protein